MAIGIPGSCGLFSLPQEGLKYKQRPGPNTHYHQWHMQDLLADFEAHGWWDAQMNAASNTTCFEEQSHHSTASFKQVECPYHPSLFEPKGPAKGLLALLNLLILPPTLV